MMANEERLEVKDEIQASGKPEVLEEIIIEELSIDGVCGVY
jgi:mycofactocin precursor